MLRIIRTGHLPLLRGLAGFGARFNYQSLSKAPHSGENYYQVLNVPVCSSEQEIKTAFIELSKKYHPDANTQTRDSEVFIKICEAYQTLHRQNSRQIYDSRLRLQNQTSSASKTAFTSREVSMKWSQYQSTIRSKQMSRNSQTFPKAMSIIFKPKATSKDLPMRVALDLQVPCELTVEEEANEEENGEEGGGEYKDEFGDEFRKSWEDNSRHNLFFYLYVAGLCGVCGLVSTDLFSRCRYKSKVSEDDSESSAPE